MRRAAWVLLLVGCPAAERPLPDAPSPNTPAPVVEAEPDPGVPAAPEGWPAGIEAPDGATVEIAARNELDPVVGVIPRPFAELWPRWRERLSLSNLVEGEWGATATVCAGQACARRWTLSTHAYGETHTRARFTPVREDARPELPGECMAIPSTTFTIIEHRSGHGFDHHLGQQIDVEQDYRWTFSPRHTWDFDRDGVLDVLVPVDTGDERVCPQDVEFDLWIRREACGHFVGHIVGDPDDVWRPPPVEMKRGLVVLPTRDDPEGPHEQAVDYTYEFDGARYVEVERQAHESRCSVHPADCDPMIHSRCRREI